MEIWSRDSVEPSRRTGFCVFRSPLERRARRDPLAGFIKKRNPAKKNRRPSQTEGSTYRVGTNVGQSSILGPSIIVESMTYDVCSTPTPSARSGGPLTGPLFRGAFRH